MFAAPGTKVTVVERRLNMLEVCDGETRLRLLTFLWAGSSRAERLGVEKGVVPRKRWAGRPRRLQH
jgi:hypothetical protein